MSRFTSSILAAVLLGQVVAQLGWIDPLFLPLVLLGPLVTGALAAARHVRYSWIAALWISAGLNMVVLDWVLFQEDVVFHLGLTAVMTVLASAGYGLVRLATRGRRVAA